MPVRHETSPSPSVGPVTSMPRRSSMAVPRTRVGAVWTGLCVGALVLVALVVFMLQNTAPVDVTFLGMHGSAPLALMLLVAGVAVGIVALAVGALRIGQLRRRMPDARRSAAAAFREAI